MNEVSGSVTKYAFYAAFKPFLCCVKTNNAYNAKFALNFSFFDTPALSQDFLYKVRR